MKRNILDQKSHEGRGKEEAKRVFETKRKLIITTSLMLFDVSEQMKYKR